MGKLASVGSGDGLLGSGLSPEGAGSESLKAGESVGGLLGDVVGDQFSTYKGTGVGGGKERKYLES